MKPSLIFRLGLGLSVFLPPGPVRPQSPAAPRPPAARPAYWNVETNATTRDYTLVRFHNGQDQLLYEERLPDLCLDLLRPVGRRRAVRQLNRALARVLRTPNATAPTTTRLARQFGGNRRHRFSFGSGLSTPPPSPAGCGWSPKTKKTRFCTSSTARKIVLAACWT